MTNFVKTCNHCCTKIDNLTVKAGNITILEDVSLHVDCGEVIAVVGPNGAGKTTLLRAILGEVPFEGKIDFQICGKPATRPRIGYVPQRLELDAGSPISVADLVAIVINSYPVWLGIPARILKKVEDVLEVFAARHLAHRRLGELSGGEAQRVLLAMAMTPKPDLLLLDEAVSGVDIEGLALFYRIVDELRKKYDITVILVTHDLSGVAAFADRVVLLNKVMIAQGRPGDILSDPKLMQAFKGQVR